MVWQDIGTTKPGFIVEDDVIDEIEDDDDEEDDLFDSVCAICDNGGDILWYVFPFFSLSGWMGWGTLKFCFHSCTYSSFNYDIV